MLAKGTRWVPRVELLRHVFGEDFAVCPKCHSNRFEILSVLTRPAAIRSVLFALGIQADTDGNVSARGPPQLELDFPTSDGQWREQESKTAAA